MREKNGKHGTHWKTRSPRPALTKTICRNRHSNNFNWTFHENTCFVMLQEVPLQDFQFSREIWFVPVLVFYISLALGASEELLASIKAPLVRQLVIATFETELVIATLPAELTLHTLVLWLFPKLLWEVYLQPQPTCCNTKVECN